ncbi:NUDIX domain-containing protein [Palleronia abyssalis]|uniref:Nudix hydrolase domain-containing protein n=1 Tax=Palleronia abyssalis TaxID=1501240 RepID=A0A2R8BYS8_9RHOB|nr:NUDIX hydrolase [Palleronia abyssalis]SPJ25246.1 hypothetical protein PAA8504_03097 [Palleronia abyssalis]
MVEEDARILNDIPVRDAATVIVVRNPDTQPAVLMGQRGKSAAFMPNKYVFPGGAVDAADTRVGLAAPISEPCRTRLSRPGEAAPEAIAAAAIRELWEETGQIAGARDEWIDPPDAWTGFARAGYRPDPGRLRYVFRAITPPGRSRRFDARFFLLPSDALVTDPDDFDAACDELGHLHWVPLAEARSLDLAFITSVALGEIEAHLPSLDAPRRVPFFRNDQAWTVLDDAIPQE